MDTLELITLQQQSPETVMVFREMVLVVSSQLPVEREWFMHARCAPKCVSKQHYVHLSVAQYVAPGTLCFDCRELL